MRWIPMCVVVAITAKVYADPCEVSIELRGAIAEGTVREQVEPSASATAFDWELPAGARLVELALRGKDGAGAAVAVPADAAVETVKDANVLAADPAIATALEPSDRGRPRYRAIVEPVAAGKDVALVARWTATADIHDGELRLVLPARAYGACKATIRAQAGPGASVTRVRVDAAATRGQAASFTLAQSDVSLAAELAFARPEPIAWLQREAVGNGTTAEAVTVLAPPTATLARVRRALFVIDTSRSMQLVGRARESKVVHAIVDALPAGAQLHAIAFARTPTPLLAGWVAADANGLDTIDKALAAQPAGNGSDLAAALVLAHNLTASSREPTLVIAITDGALGGGDGTALARALGDPHAVDLHAVVLDVGDRSAYGRDVLIDAIDRVGGSYVELATDDHERLASWLEPGWFGISATGTSLELPAQLRAGEGAVRFAVTRTPHAIALAAHDEDGKVAIAAHAAAQASVAAASGHRPVVDRAHALVVLATAGKVARDRRAMIAGGGPFTRMIATDDPPGERKTPPAPVVARNAGLDRDILQRLFELQLQPKAFICYQHALSALVAQGRPPVLAGTARFSLELGRGEVTTASVSGLGDAAFDACLVDAAYALEPPLPDPDADADERTIATYPLTFQLRAGDKPFVVSGDADSSSPIDIDAIRGGAARPAPAPRVDTSTPLGPLRPTPMP